MDPVKILKRAWHILWSYRALWVFGLILAIAGAGSHGNNSNSGTRYERDSQGNHQPLPEDMQGSFKDAGQEMQKLFYEGLDKAGLSEKDVPTLIWIGVILLVVMILTGIALAVARYVSETAVIRMVDEYESTGSKMTIREGFRIGWSRTSWRLFLINLLVSLPVFLLVLAMLALGVVIFLAFAGNNEGAKVFSTVGSIGIFFLLIFVVVVVSIFLSLLRHFFWRVCALENATVGESLRRGFQMARENWKSVGVMWLIMIGLGIAWAVVSFIAFILTLPVVAVTAFVAVLVAGIPALLVGGLTSLFLSGWMSWVVGAIIALPLFFTIMFSPWLLLSGWQVIYSSTVWTLVYRELKALPVLTNGSAPVQEAPAS